MDGGKEISLPKCLYSFHGEIEKLRILVRDKILIRFMYNVRLQFFKVEASSWPLFAEIRQRCHTENKNILIKLLIAPHFFYCLLQLLSAATAMSLTSRTGTSRPRIRCTGSELWSSSPVTPATLWSRGPLWSNASVRGIRTGTTQSPFAKVTLKAGSKLCVVLSWTSFLSATLLFQQQKHQLGLALQVGNRKEKKIKNIYAA